MNDVELRHQANKEFAISARSLIIETLNDPNFSLLISTKSSRTDVVTQIDQSVEALITNAISKQFPNDAIIGEEFGLSGGNGSYEWVIDPIDGTTNFIYGFPAFAISIAVRTTQENEVVSGVVYDVPRDRLYEATKGGGSFANGNAIKVTDQDEIADSLIATGFSYSNEIRIRQGKIIQSILTKVRDIRRAGAASLDLCMVAAGEIDGYFEEGLKPWDYMAGALIVREAGGKVDGAWTEEPTAQMIVASNGSIQKALVNLITPV